MPWAPSQNINYALDGDMTLQAIYKLMQQITEIYAKLNFLRRLGASGASPPNPEPYDVWINPQTFEVMIYTGGQWVSQLKVQTASMSLDSQKLGGEFPAFYVMSSDFVSHAQNTEIHMLEGDREKLGAVNGIGETRPETPAPGQCWFDTELGKPIWWTGEAWMTADGEAADGETGAQQ
jgi:hypothetical protein